MVGTERMSAADYLAMVKKTGSRSGSSSGGRMLRLPASFLQDREQGLIKQTPVEGPTDGPNEPKGESSAAKARSRVASVVDALKSARTEVQYEVLDGGRERLTVRVFGGETLPPNRAANIGREQSKISQRSFSSYKHACADRMEDAAILLRMAVQKEGRTRFNSQFLLTHIRYTRQVTRKSRQLDEDAVAFSFKYILDGLVRAGVLVDDSRRYIRIIDAEQAVGQESLLTIELETQCPV